MLSRCPSAESCDSKILSRPSCRCALLMRRPCRSAFAHQAMRVQPITKSKCAVQFKRFNIGSLLSFKAPETARCGFRCLSLGCKHTYLDAPFAAVQLAVRPHTIYTHTVTLPLHERVPRKPPTLS
jgi:hypothetical protein